MGFGFRQVKVVIVSCTSSKLKANLVPKSGKPVRQCLPFKKGMSVIFALPEVTPNWDR
jgi:hypothetical protein